MPTDPTHESIAEKWGIDPEETYTASQVKALFKLKDLHAVYNLLNTHSLEGHQLPSGWLIKGSSIIDYLFRTCNTAPRQSRL